MEKTKREMDETKKGIIGVVAFLLCLFFFMFPLVQYTQDNNIAPTGWEIARKKYIPITSGIYVNAINGGTITTIPQGSATEGKTVYIYITPNQDYQLANLSVMSAIGPINEQNTDDKVFFTMPASDVTINGTFEPVESEQLSEYDTNELDTTIREVSKYLKVNILRESNINFLVFALLIIPVVVIILLFTKVSFGMLRNVFIIGTTVNIACIILVYTLYGDYFIPTMFSWIIFTLYIGLFVFSHYCINSE